MEERERRERNRSLRWREVDKDGWRREREKSERERRLVGEGNGRGKCQKQMEEETLKGSKRGEENRREVTEHIGMPWKQRVALRYAPETLASRRGLELCGL